MIHVKHQPLNERQGMTTISPHACQIDAKREESQRIAKATAEWVRKNGPIPVIDPSVFADPTLPACANMRYRSKDAAKSKSVGLSRMHQVTRRKVNNNDIFGGEE